MRAKRAALLIALLLVVPLGHAQGQEAGDPEMARVADELAALNRTMSKLAELLTASLERSDLELLLKRLEMAQREVSPREDRLEKAREELTSLTEQESQLRAMADQIEEEARSSGQPGSGMTGDELRQQRTELERGVQFLKDRMRAAQQRVIDLENELAADRRAIAAWQEEIDHRLGLR